MKFKKYTHIEDFVFDNGQIKLTESGLLKSKKNLKKITGSRIAGVLGKSEFDSPFQVWCDILGFVQKEMEDFFTSVGTIIEPVLVDFAAEKLNKKLRTYDPQSERYDLFKNNKIFGGLSDAEEWVDGKIKSIIEIKTASMDKYTWTQKDNELKLVRANGQPIIKEEGKSISKWFKNKTVSIPLNYQYQLSLYLYLRNIETGYFCVALLKDQFYKKPMSFDVTDIDQEHAKIDFNSKDYVAEIYKCNKVVFIEEMKLNLKEFQKVIDSATKWYEDHVLKGISPQLTGKDKTWFKYGFPNI